MSDNHPIPSDRARELVRGGYDPHIHISPDVVERRISDVQLAGRFLDLGLAGFGLKSHYTSTAERARVVSEAVPGIHVLGAITLNRAVGNLNPTAIKIATHESARIVWFPTVSSENEQHEVLAADPDGTVLRIVGPMSMVMGHAGIGSSRPTAHRGMCPTLIRKQHRRH